MYSYSHAILDDGRLHMSGQVGINADGELAGDNIGSQAQRAYENVAAILAAADAAPDAVRKVTAYVVDPQSRYGDYHDVWLETFDDPYPCHTVVGVEQLATEEYLIEIEVEASVS